MARSSAIRRTMSVSSNPTEAENDFKHGVTLVFIALLFIACQSPKLIPDIYEVLHCNRAKVITFFRYM